MTGLLIVNGFIDSSKFSELYGMLAAAAKAEGVELITKKTTEISHSLKDVQKERCDFVLFWDKDVLLAETFEACGVRVFNSATSIFYCDNKAYTALKLAGAGVRTPETVASPLTFEGVGYNDTEFALKAAEKLGYPLVVKENYGSFGAQVYLVRDADELITTVRSLGHKGFIMQEFISDSFGRDLRVNVVGGRVVSSMLRIGAEGDFRSNITNGGRAERYEAGEEQKRAAIAACRALGLDFAGVDVLFGKDGEPIVCEVNSNPHFKSTLECTGKDLGVEIVKHVKERLN